MGRDYCDVATLDQLRTQENAMSDVLNFKEPPNAQQAYSVVYAKVNISVVLICACKNVLLVLDQLFAPAVCPVCGVSYVMDQIQYDASAHLKQHGTLPENARVSMNVVRVEPLIARPVQ